MATSLRADLIYCLSAAGDPARAEGQKRYMRSELPFHGVRVPEVRRLARAVITDHPLPNPDAWKDAVLSIWRRATHREQRYAAIELAYAQPYRRWLRPDALAMVEEMIVTGAWEGAEQSTSGPSVDGKMPGQRATGQEQ